MDVQYNSEHYFLMQPEEHPFKQHPGIQFQSEMHHYRRKQKSLSTLPFALATRIVHSRNSGAVLLADFLLTVPIFVLCVIAIRWHVSGYCIANEQNCTASSVYVLKRWGVHREKAVLCARNRRIMHICVYKQPYRELCSYDTILF